MATDIGPLARTLSVPYYDDALPAHDVFHAKRVRDLSLRLAAACDESVDTDVLAAAAWLHDIGRPRERTGAVDDHDEWATEETARLLAAEGVEENQITAVQRCIRAHSIRPSSPDPDSIEARLLFDADKLDAAGAVGLLRLACIAGERSGRSGEAYAALDPSEVPEADTTDRPDVSLLREWTRERLDALHTDPARRLGAERWDFVALFFERLHGEVGPEAEL